MAPAARSPTWLDYLDLVALGTVADVVTLDENNRILVEQGLQRIRAGRCCPGVRALISVAGRDPDRATARDLGFAAGPRLNAAGRLTEMSLGVECLLTDDPDLAMDLARQLDGLNRERRSIEGGMREEAQAMVEALRLDHAGLPAGLCLFGEGWHQGVTGIVAARIRERYQRPTIAFGDAGDGRLRGSARSVEAANIRDLIDTVDKVHPGLIERFGGHAMAAGLTLPAKPISTTSQRPLRPRFAPSSATVRRSASWSRTGSWCRPASTSRPRSAAHRAAPGVRDFPEPLFDGVFDVLDRRLVGDGHLRLRLRPAQAEVACEHRGHRLRPR